MRPGTICMTWRGDAIPDVSSPRSASAASAALNQTFETDLDDATNPGEDLGSGNPDLFTGPLGEDGRTDGHLDRPLLRLHHHHAV